MNPEIVFGLENASWPALLVAMQGAILRAKLVNGCVENRGDFLENGVGFRRMVKSIHFDGLPFTKLTAWSGFASLRRIRSDSVTI